MLTKLNFLRIMDEGLHLGFSGKRFFGLNLINSEFILIYELYGGSNS